MCGTQEPVSAFRVPGKLGQSGFRCVPGRNQKSGFKWVSVRDQKKSVLIGCWFQVGTPKSGFWANWAKLGSVTVLKKV